MTERAAPKAAADAPSSPGDADVPSVLRDPFGWYAVKSVQRPVTVFVSAWAVIVLLCAAGLPLFEQTPNSDYDWLLGDDKIVSRSYALKKVQEENALYSKVSERSVKQNEQLMHFMYESKSGDGNLLTPGFVKEMLSVEKTFFESKKFATYCVANVSNTSVCSDASAQSVINLFYVTKMVRDAKNETIATVTPITDPATGSPYVDTQAGVNKRLAAVMANDATAVQTKLFFDTGFDASNLKARYVQSFYFLGMPLDGYNNPADRNEKQRKSGDEFIVGVSGALKERFGLKETFSKSSFQTAAIADTADGSMKVYWWSLPIQENEWLVLSDKDLGWTILSFIGVGCYIAYHTGSIVISATSMLMTVCSIFVAYFFFRVVFMVSFFQFINFLIIFVVLGIGADDVFVFMDAFHQSLDELRAEGKPATLPHRIRHTMYRALHAIFVTSFTTSAAFLATAMSPLIPLRSFGIFSALVIFSVFFINAVVLPPLTVLYVRNLMGRSWLDSFKAFTCGLCATAPYVDPAEKLPETTKEEEVDSTTEGEGPNAAVLRKYNPAHMRWTERFFFDIYFKFLKGRAKYVILASFAALFAAGVAIWVTLEVPKEPEQWFPKSHMFQQYQDLGSAKVMVGGGSASSLMVSILWGISGVNDKGTDPWIPDDLGTVEYNAAFDPSTAESQAWIMQTYENLKKAPCSAKACRGGILVDPDDPIRNILAETDSAGKLSGGFYVWLRTQGGLYTAAHPTTAPVTGPEFNLKMCEYSKLELTKLRYPSHVGYMTEKCDVTPVPVAKFILIEATSSIRMPQAPADFEKAQQQWEAFSSSTDLGAPSTLTGAQATSTNIFWLWSVTSLSLMDNVYLGLAVCFPGVFAVLTVSTGNIVLAFFSTVTIAGIVTTVIGIGAGGLMGWDLGTTEAIAAVIVIGFSVDYCVHLANAYIENDATDRETRTRIALTTMGISVTAGAITTIIAGVFLSLCILTFFVKFSFLICWTIISSYLWAVVFFGALCMTIGPSGKFGDVSWIMRKICPWCTSPAH